MGKHKDANWYISASKSLIEVYGDIPPPWIYAPTYHPYSMGWRMGGGESHIMVLGEWMDQQALNFDERVTYLQKYPATPRWCLWMIHFLWRVNPDELGKTELENYFTKLSELGFENTSDFEKDFNREDLD